MTVRLVWGVGGNAESYCEGQMAGFGSTNFQPNSNKDSSAGMVGKGNIIWIFPDNTSHKNQFLAHPWPSELFSWGICCCAMHCYEGFGNTPISKKKEKSVLKERIPSSYFGFSLLNKTRGSAFQSYVLKKDIFFHFVLPHCALYEGHRHTFTLSSWEMDLEEKHHTVLRLLSKDLSMGHTLVARQLLPSE